MLKTARQGGTSMQKRNICSGDCRRSSQSLIFVLLVLLLAGCQLAPVASTFPPTPTPVSTAVPTAAPTATPTVTPTPIPSPPPTPTPTTAPLPTAKPTAKPTSPPADEIPSGFTSIKAVVPSVDYDIRYFSGNNFIGRRIDGYLAAEAYLTAKAANALKKVADQLETVGYRLLIYDAYRPKRAVAAFVSWTEDLDDIANKAEYYPDLNKSQLIGLGFIARRSAHSRGSTVDLTLITMDGALVDMGSPFDFFGPISYHDTSLINTQQLQYRDILRQAMIAGGFRAYSKEWWHYALNNEPYPSTYFDFSVK
jgi:D-alanyl-D-alanine dipeptidase